MSFRARRRLPRAWLLATVATLGLAAVGASPAFAGEPISDHAIAPSILKPDPIPEPRIQEPGQTSGFRLPFAAGQELRIEQGWNTTFSHYGKNAYAYDIGMAIGTDVTAAAAGLVAFVHDGETACGGPDLLDNANYVTIYHADGSATLYAHLSEVGVKVGDVVVAGQVIGKSGNTGYTHCIPHLHFARQYLGSGVAQSVPVYFQGYAKQELHSGDLVSVPAAPCAPPAGAAAAMGTWPEPVSAQPSATRQVQTGRIQDLGTFCGVYYGGDLDQPKTMVRRDNALRFDWRAKGPGGYWLDDAAAAFGARWTGAFAFPAAGTYAIGVRYSGAVIVSIDGVRVVDRWIDDGRLSEAVVSKVLGAGIHRVDVEYLAANGHGSFTLGWGRVFAGE